MWMLVILAVLAAYAPGGPLEVAFWSLIFAPALVFLYIFVDGFIRGIFDDK